MEVAAGLTVMAVLIAVWGPQLIAWLSEWPARNEAAYQRGYNGYNEEREHQRELLKEMREATLTRAPFTGVDFVLMPCICRAEGARFAIDCRRCDDTGYVEVVV